ncbi:MAG: sensor histidine kinase [Clostridia bacterium]|nr:sensor histidine kinase [Clostridia bacterium]
MKELSLNVLDVAENSYKAGAKQVCVSLQETGNRLTLTIQDDGCGMTPDILKVVTDPFYTTRTTRKVGLGLPLLRMAAEQTGGGMTVKSVSEKENPASHGTTVTAVFYTDHLDFTPLGDIVSTVTTLIQGHPTVDLLFTHETETQSVRLDTAELREVLGDVSLAEYEVIHWIEDCLKEQYEAINK